MNEPSYRRRLLIHGDNSLDWTHLFRWVGSIWNDELIIRNKNSDNFEKLS